MNTNEELLRKWQLKKIATLAFINDECDDMKPKDRKAFYSMMEAIFGEIVGDLKNLALPHVSVPLPVIMQVLKYCEDNQIYDKLGTYQNFYYKLNQIRREHDDSNAR